MLKQIIKSTALLVATATPLLALPIDPVGQPFAVITPTGPNTILDYFDVFGPTGVKLVSLNGTVTETFGWDSAMGASFSFESGAQFDPTTMTIGGEQFSSTPGGGVDLLDEIFGSGAYDFDPFSGDGPGDMVFNFMIGPDYVEDLFIGPTAIFSYPGFFEEFGPREAVFPEFGLQLSVYLGGGLPTKTFDPSTIGDPFPPFDYIEGPLSVDYMTLGLIGGAPVAPVPLPAGLPLLAAACATFGFARRTARRT